MDIEQASLDVDLFGSAYHVEPVATCAVPLVELMHCPDAIWLCRMGTPVEQALEQVRHRKFGTAC